MHLLSLVADRLWLVRGGRVAPYEGDLDSYRAELLAEPAAPRAPKPAAPRAPDRQRLATLRSEARAAETRIAKLEELRDEVAARLADPAAYQGEQLARTEALQKKFAEINAALEKAEALWVAAVERLEAAEA